ncbi:MAG TPA: UPF0182 family protein [Bryobacteraceae bacterium]|nr:UPF0182 family protein [Bryobacteraceae bacterium]
MTLELPRRRGQPQSRIGLLIGLVIVLLLFSRTICALILDYAWWGELHQVPTWLRMSAYQYGPGLAAWLILFLVLWIAHARGLKHAGTHLADHRLYGRLATLGLAVLALIVALSVVDGWTVARFFGGENVTSGYRDPVFGRNLAFYFFELPFYSMLINFVTACALAGGAVHYATARGWQLKRDFPSFGSGNEIDLRELRALGSLESAMFKGLVVLFLLAMAAQFWIGRFDFLFTDHGNLMSGVDYVQQNIELPMQAVKVFAALLAAALVIAGRRKLAIACAVVLLFDWALPPLVSSLYVKPNELALEKPYLARHIEATRSAYGIDRRAKESEFPARKEGRIDFVKNRPLLENVRLWDWRAFHDTLSQSQPLRPYTYADTDVDRYTIDGKLRQVLLAPRELDLNQLGDARHLWVNSALTFTHGYGLVLAEASRITATGLPELLVKSAPIEVLNPGLNISKPEIYFAETSHEPVFVRTAQPEFNYPSTKNDGGSSEVNTRYEGRGGFPMSSFGMRLVAAIAEGDPNILLTHSLTPESRMMIRRRVPERLGAMAGFITWDKDPYLVIGAEGRLVWMVDGYTTSGSHPYSREMAIENGERFNYLRNSIKATVDAYDGDVHLYIFDEADPLIAAYRKLFPELFTPASAMPEVLRAHARSPEMLFRAQAEIFRTYHMRDPESFYNRADQWDVATGTAGQGGSPSPVAPTYMVMTLPGETQPEFLLMLPFTPRNKQNLIGLMVARCDGPHLGELLFLDLPKQEVIAGPLQVDALINQDQTISKDLTLWNQQGSQVLRSQILALPIDHTFLYVAPIYIQASEARMPQLKKVALVMGNTLVYADTYEQALAELDAVQKGLPAPATVSSAPAQAAPMAMPLTGDARIDEVRAHLKRYRDFAAQGKWADAGKELEAIEQVVKK